MNKQLIIFCLPLSDLKNDEDTILEPHNSMEQYEHFDNNEIVENTPQIWYGKENIITNNTIYERKISNTMIQYSYENVHKQWPIKTSYLCFWCCHKFDNRPHFIPKKYEKDIFHVYGNFCSFNCALAFINAQKKQHSMDAELLHFLYRKIYNSNIEIKPAPPKEILIDFGGNVTIEEFRSNFNNNLEYDIIYPPIISMISQISESTKLKSINTIQEIKHKPIQIKLFEKPKKMVQRKLFS